MPYRRHRFMDGQDQSVKFRFVRQQILSLNVDFFRDKIVNERVTYFCSLKVSYNFEDHLTHSIDLGLFPTRRVTKAHELTRDQQAYLLSCNRDVEKEPTKLVSTHEEGIMNDFIVAILYQSLFHSLEIHDVFYIIEYQVADIISPWLHQLGEKRACSSSNVESKLYKNLGNVICKYFHLIFTNI